MIKILIRFVLILIVAVNLSSCASVPQTISGIPSPGYVPFPQPQLRQGVYHSVAPGETLWRIGKMFDVPVRDIVSANGLKRSQIEIGQRLFIPNAASLRPVVTLYPSRRWKYIVVHHSAAASGNAARINSMHLNKGWNGAGYHFIIDNGTKDKQDGQIEPTVRWIKQQIGAHCQAAGMNSKAIGICLIGNFNLTQPSEGQLDALVYLANLLRNRYGIPSSNIVGHSQVPGARTDCPGKRFPWSNFKSRLNSQR